MASIYLGNLPPTATEEEVGQLFGHYGEVAKVTLIVDRESGKLRGFGFVEMSDASAEQAIAALDGHDYGGCLMRVNEARDRGATPPRRSW